MDSSNSYKSLDNLHRQKNKSRESLSVSDSQQNLKFIHEIETLRKILLDFNKKNERLSPPKPDVTEQLRAENQFLQHENADLKDRLRQM